MAIVLFVLLWFTASDYPFGIFWPLYCLFFFDLLLLITPLVFFGHCIVCSSLVYCFWLHLWYLHTFLMILQIFVSAIFNFYMLYYFIGNWVSEWLLFNVKWVIFNLYHGDKKTKKKPNRHKETKMGSYINFHTAI